MIAAMRTVNSKLLMVPRLIAALPLVILGIAHITPEGAAHFRNILKAADTPFLDFNAFAGPIAEITAGVLLAFGFLGRLGGLLGAATMGPAIYATLKIQGLDVDHLPAGLTAIPQVPPLPVPVAVLICSLIVMILGSGRYSMDFTLTRPRVIEG